MRARLPPWILLAINERQAVIRDIIAAVFIDSVGIRRRGDVESFSTDNCREGEVDEAGYKREGGVGYAGTGLEVAPLGAVLVWPGSPCLGDVGLGVESGVMGVVAAVDVWSAACYES